MLKFSESQEGLANRACFLLKRRPAAARFAAIPAGRYHLRMKATRKSPHHPGRHKPLPARPRVGLFFSLDSSWHTILLDGITDYLVIHGPWDVYFNQFGDIPHNPTTLRKMRLDGLLLGSASLDPSWPRHQRLVKALGIPTVLILSDPHDSGLVEVVPDDLAVGRLAAQHLLDKGFRNFAYYGGDIPFARIRRDGFVSALAAAGHPCAVHLRTRIPWGKLHLEWQAGTLGPWLSSLPKPTGAMACSDLWARHLAYTCQRLGLRVPEDIALVGVDNIESLCRIISPELSSIPLNLRQQGFMAAEALAALMHGKTFPNPTIRVPPLPLVARHSSDMLAVDDRAVGDAARFIQANAPHALTVDQVLDHVMISRRKLELGFKRNFGRTPQEEIWRVHVERAKQVLEQTSLKMERIAQISGFASAAHMSRTFRRQTGVPPRVWRDQHRADTQGVLPIDPAPPAPSR